MIITVQIVTHAWNKTAWSHWVSNVSGLGTLMFPRGKFEEVEISYNGFDITGKTVLKKLHTVASQHLLMEDM